MTQASLSPTGIVLTYHSNFYKVLVSGLRYECFVKGILKKEGGDVLVGDYVTLDNLDETSRTGRIKEVLPRKNQLERPKIANITQAIVVASIAQPALDLTQLDRYITRIYLVGVQPVICLSKADLLERDTWLQEIKAIYEPLGTPLYTTSVQTPDSIEALFAQVKGQVVVLAGQSGVGKSTLLNSLQPELNLAVGKVSAKAQRGQHTTRQVALIALDETTYVADSPGFSYLKFDTVLPQALEQAFPEFAPYRDHCKFDNCLHLDEIGCHVKENLAHMSASRYLHYCQFQQEAQTFVETTQSSSQKEEYGYKTLKKGKGEAIKILRLKEKQRDSSRRTQKQALSESLLEDDTLEES